MKQKNGVIMTVVMAGALFFSASNQKQEETGNGLLIVKEQGSFAVGGKVIQNEGTYTGENFDNFKPYPEGQSYHGDHAYVFYQIPDKARQLPLVFLHGAGQSSKTWETTPDGREGFQTIFLRKGRFG